MAAIRDLDPCAYIPIACDAFRAVGWLGAGTEYARGSVPDDFFEKLKALCADPWQPVVSMGGHTCELCQFEPPCFGNNVYVPFGSHIYVAPVGVVHYIAAHWYAPPEVFIRAVLECPSMRSIGYYKALVASGGRELIGVAEG